MNKIEPVKNDIVLKGQNITVDEYLKKEEVNIQRLLPNAGITADRMIAVVYNCMLKTPKLAECDILSLTGAILASAQYGLLPGVECHILPFDKRKDNKVIATNATFIMDYKGVCTLLGRNENVVDINAEVVYENEEFDYQKGSSPSITHKPCISGERGEMIGAYCIINQINGGKTILFMRKDEIEEIRAMSSAWSYAVYMDKKNNSEYNRNNTIWHKHQVDMWKKTVIKKASKTLNLTGTSKMLFQSDEAILRYNENAKSEHDIIDAEFSVDQEEVKPEIPVYNPTPKLETPIEVVEVEAKTFTRKEITNEDIVNHLKETEPVQEKSMSELENMAKSLKSEIDKMDNTNINKVYGKVKAFGNNKLISYFKKKATNYELVDDVWVLKAIEPINPVVEISKGLVDKLNMNSDPCNIPEYDDNMRSK